MMYKIYFVNLITYIVYLLIFPGLVYSESATIVVNGDASLGQVNPLIFGTNLVTDSDTGEGVWDPRTNLPNQEMLKITKETGVKFLRFPGGCIAHRYQWKNGIGPLNARPESTSIFEHQHGNKFGLHEFIAFCKAVEAEPIITVSYFAGGPEEAAELVEYCNGSADSIMGALRKTHGHLEPFNVKYWEVGNEVWHGDSIPHNNLSLDKVTPLVYAHLFKKFAYQMKQKDPSIQIGAVGFESGVKGFDSFGMYWNQNLLEIAENDIDFLAVHSYLPGYHTKPSLDPVGHFKALMAASNQTVHGLNEIQSIWKEVSSVPEKKLWIAFTEYHAGFLSEERFSWAGALFTADFIMMMLAPQSQVLGANYMEHSNGFWGMFQDSNPVKKRLDAEVFELLSQNIGNLIVPVEISCSSFEAPDIGFIQPSSTLAPIGEGINFSSKVVEDNIVKDPGFEQGNFSGPWHSKPIRGASINIDSKISHTGKNSVRVEFDGTGDVNFLNVFQIADLIPGNSYRLSGYIKTENIKPNNSVCLAIMDSNDYQLFNLYTLRLAGTNEWTRVEKIFKVPAKVNEALLMLRRFEGEGNISGTAWFDDISITTYNHSQIENPSILTAFASKTKNNGAFNLLVINRSPDKSIDTTISFSGMDITANNCSVKTFMGDGSGEDSLFAQQMKRVTENIIVSQKAIKYKLSPASLTCFSFN